MSIFEKAKELAEEITESPELRRVKETELRVMIDLEAREIIEQYQKIQADAVNKGIGYEDLEGEEKTKLEELETKMNDNPIINDYLTASHELNQILESINMIIASSLNGGESGCTTCSSGDCSSGCSSCGH